MALSMYFIKCLDIFSQASQVINWITIYTLFRFKYIFGTVAEALKKSKCRVHRRMHDHGNKLVNYHEAITYCQTFDIVRLDNARSLSVTLAHQEMSARQDVNSDQVACTELWSVQAPSESQTWFAMCSPLTNVVGDAVCGRIRFLASLNFLMSQLNDGQ